MFKMCKVNNKGSATVEITAIMGIIITMILVIMYVSFFLHDYTVTSAQIKYNLMKDNENYKSILFMGELHDRTYNRKNNKYISEAKLRYNIPLLGTKSWKISISEQVTSIDNIRKIKVYKDGINQFKQN